MHPIEKLILTKLARGPAWANSFRHAKPVVERLVQKGLVVRCSPPGGKAKNMIALIGGIDGTD